MTFIWFDVGEGEDGGDEGKEEIPDEASAQVLWTLRRGLAIPYKVQNRLSDRAQREIYQLGLVGLKYTAALVDILEWVSKIDFYWIIQRFFFFCNSIFFSNFFCFCFSGRNCPVFRL